MAKAPPPPLLLLSFFLSLATSALTTDPTCQLPPDQGNTLRIIHAYGPCSPFRPSRQLSFIDTLLDLDSKDDSRLLYLSNLVAVRGVRPVAPIASGRQILSSANYIVRASLGLPAQPLLLALDTSSDAAWLPCGPCTGCPSPAFNSEKSKTFSTVECGELECKRVPNPWCRKNSLRSTCSFNVTYGGAAFEAGVSQDTFRIAGSDFPGYTFGCLEKVIGPANALPPQGLLGLGRGQVSMLSQTQSTFLSTFSYCLPSFRSLNFSGSLRLGPKYQPVRIKYTPLLTNPHRPSLYYVNMVGIRVGRRVVNIPPSALAFNPSTGAGTIIDSGTMFTRLVEPAYIAVRDEFRRRVKGGGNVTSLGGFDTCYNGPITAPTITFQFVGMEMTLPVDNILIHSTAGSITCLAMAAAPTNVNSVLSVIANMQQQNHRVLFDVPNSRIGVAREACTL